MARLEIVFGRKKTVGRKMYPFRGNLFEHPARYSIEKSERKSFLESTKHYTSQEVCKRDARNYQRSRERGECVVMERNE